MLILYKVIIIISTYTNMEIERLRDLKAIGYRSMGVKISFFVIRKSEWEPYDDHFFNYFAVFMPVYQIVIWKPFMAEKEWYQYPKDKETDA